MIGDDILNPLEIPAFPILFKAHRSDGRLTVHEANCAEAGVSVEKTRNCLSPEKLNLNSNHLTALRKATLDGLNKQMAKLSAGLTEEEAMVMLAKAVLKKDAHGYWPRFFTTIRSYLGKEAEKHLHEINYSG